MDVKNISFNDLPEAIMFLIGKMETIEQIVKEKEDRSDAPADEWMGLDGLKEYLPDKPAKATIYGWVSTKQMPYHKGGKKLRFRKSEIDAWLEAGKRRCGADFEAEANEYLAKREKKLKYA
jgi:excisionase family DNA binding protein